MSPTEKAETLLDWKNILLIEKKIDGFTLITHGLYLRISECLIDSYGSSSDGFKYHI